MRALQWITVVSLIAAGIAVATAPVSAQNYPIKPVRFITGSNASFGDIVTRNIAQRLNERWGQPVVVENRPGAGLTIGTTIAAKSPPDGYTLLMGDRTSIAAAPSLYRNLSYDPLKDLAPITLVASAPMLLVAHPSIPPANLREFIAYAKQASQPLGYASAGIGTATHLPGEQLKQLTGIDLVAVHYKGGGAAMLAMLAGEVKAGFSVVPLALPHVRAGKVKAYVITTRKRFAGASDIPTVVEAGLPDLESDYWIGMFVPAHTQTALIGKINRDVVDILQTPAMRTALLDQGAEPGGGTPEEFAALIKSEIAKWGRVIKTAGIKPE